MLPHLVVGLLLGILVGVWLHFFFFFAAHIPLFEYVKIYLHILQLMDIWVVSSVWLL